MNFIAWFIFVAAAILEVAGDATVRRGLRGGGVWFIVAGCLALGGYGLIVNAGNVGIGTAAPVSTLEVDN